MATAPPAVSFIVPAHDEEECLPATLRAICDAAEASRLGFEMIVVDDSSQDRTAEVAERLGARVVRVGHRRISCTRNSGAREARADWLVFVDADTLVSREVVAGMARALASGAVGGGSAFRFDGRVPLYGRVLERLANFLCRRAQFTGGCFLFCSREAFEEIGGFDEQLAAAEEWVLSRALGRRGRFVLLREAVTTSGRKVRAYSLRELIGSLLVGSPFVSRGFGAHPALWYGVRRPDPDPAPQVEGRTPSAN
jgi:glycosyltransferase involved in cell wall biosynthesis